MQVAYVVLTLRPSVIVSLPKNETTWTSESISSKPSQESPKQSMSFSSILLLLL